MNILASWKQRRADKRAERRAKARSDEIDRQLMEERKCRGQQRDILLIGSCSPSFAILAVVRGGAHVGFNRYTWIGSGIVRHCQVYQTHT
jgi:hypothetical protein